MQANWSLVINTLLLMIVVVSISRVLKSKRQQAMRGQYQPMVTANNYAEPDEIIAVRKIDNGFLGSDDNCISPLTSRGVSAGTTAFSDPTDNPEDIGWEEDWQRPRDEPVLRPVIEPSLPKEQSSYSLSPKRGGETTQGAEEVLSRGTLQRQATNKEPSNAATIMFFLLAKANRQLAGYELLQSILSCGLRFGEGNLFHRHQFANGQGPILCSLAAATESGVFDLQNMGAFSVRGLCLFMQASGNPAIDGERFSIMLETAKQLSEGLDAYLLDDQRKPLTDDIIDRYHQLLHLDGEQHETV